MKADIIKKTALAVAAVALFASAQTAVAGPKEDAAALARYRTAERIGKEQLAKFDTLDFDVYSNQQWDRLKESHSADILVHYPDGHTSKGLAAHIEELKPMFTFAPNTKIRVHPIKIAAGGEWTSVIGVMDEEYLFWDNADFMKQIGVGQ